MNGMSAMPPPGFSRSDIKEDMAILSCLAFSAGWLPRYVGDGVTLDVGSSGRKLLLHPAPLSLLVACWRLSFSHSRKNVLITGNIFIKSQHILAFQPSGEVKEVKQRREHHSTAFLGGSSHSI
jgi:hypothetical protein